MNYRIQISSDEKYETSSPAQIGPPFLERQKLSLLHGTELVVEVTASLEGGDVLSILRLLALAQDLSR
jgi:hypothetical protein